MSLYTSTQNWLTQQAKHQSEYLQATDEVLKHIVPIVNANEDYKSHNVLQRVLIPQQVFQFAVVWETDEGEVKVNNGWRIQHNNLLGPYKGGTRFHKSVNLSVLKFLAFEQSFKNALTGLLIGSGKGGADFDPSDCSEREIRRFCKAYIRALDAQIGATVDVPAGDINVSSKEIGYMFGELLRLNKKHEGMLSGKPTSLGGSNLRIEATGYGVMYFAKEMLNNIGDKIEDKKICISGAGNVARYCAQQAIKMGATVLSLSNSKGTFYCENGLSEQHIDWLNANQSKYNNALDELSNHLPGEFTSNSTPWTIKADIAIPCATQNEIDKDAAATIVKNFSTAIVEGANMPCTSAATQTILDSDILYAPGKAANAGGVIVSAFEMQQHASMKYYTAYELDKRLQQRMKAIHDSCANESKALGNKKLDYVQGANVAGFRKLADAIVASGY